MKYWIMHSVLLANFKRAQTEPNLIFANLKRNHTELKANPYRTKRGSEPNLNAIANKRGFFTTHWGFLRTI